MAYCRARAVGSTAASSRMRPAMSCLKRARGERATALVCVPKRLAYQQGHVHRQSSTTGSFGIRAWTIGRSLSHYLVLSGRISTMGWAWDRTRFSQIARRRGERHMPRRRCADGRGSRGADGENIADPSYGRGVRERCDRVTPEQCWSRPSTSTRRAIKVASALCHDTDAWLAGHRQLVPGWVCRHASTSQAKGRVPDRACMRGRLERP
jgi:hypothetical protein